METSDKGLIRVMVFYAGVGRAATGQPTSAASRLSVAYNVGVASDYVSRREPHRSEA